MSTLRWPGVPCLTSVRRCAHKRFHTGPPLSLPFDGLRLGRQSAREAASPVDAGTVVSRMAEETVIRPFPRNPVVAAVSIYPRIRQDRSQQENQHEAFTLPVAPAAVTVPPLAGVSIDIGQIDRHGDDCDHGRNR